MPKGREGRIPETPTLTTGESLCLLFIRSAVLEAVSIVHARLALGSCPLSVQGCHSWHLPAAHATLMPLTAMFDLRGGQKTRDAVAVCKHKAWEFIGPV